MVLVGLLSSLSGLLKLKGKVDIDSPIFKLHYSLTSTVLFCFCLLVTATSLIGDPIACMFDSSHDLMSTDVVNTYCWIHSTFTLPPKQNNDNGRGGTGSVIHPGVGTHRRADEKVYHAYYQWVPFVLFLQGILFYAPRWLWSTWEGGKVASVVMGLSQPVMNKDERKEKIHLLAEYLHASMHSHNIYAIKFFFCEVLNFIILVVNLVVMNNFLGGKFYSYGTDVLHFTQIDQEERTDPMIALFPRMTKCNYKMFGPSGTIEIHDFLCVLPHNIINEKIYVILWFWFWILTIVSSIAIVYRVAVLFTPSIRLYLLEKRARVLNKNDADVISKNFQFGDFFLLYLLGKNVSFLSYSDLMMELSGRIANRCNNSALEMTERDGMGVKGYYQMNL